MSNNNQPHKWVLGLNISKRRTWVYKYFNGYNDRGKPLWVYSERQGRKYPYGEWKMDKEKLEELGYNVKTISIL